MSVVNQLIYVMDNQCRHCAVGMLVLNINRQTWGCKVLCTQSCVHTHTARCALLQMLLKLIFASHSTVISNM